MVVRGKDNDDRPLFILMDRRSSEIDNEGYFISRLFLNERAMAAAEFLGQQQTKISAVFRFADYQSKNSPPLACVKHFLGSLQRYYPERLFRAVIVDPPFWMRAAYALVKPFLKPDTREKVVMAHGDVSVHPRYICCC